MGRLLHSGLKAWPCHPALITMFIVVGGIVSPLWIGWQPVGGDPERIYRPIKAALATAIDEGTLPFWSDAFGIGLPLIAESHVAAFYPFNTLVYGIFPVDSAYRISMWCHVVLLGLGTYQYARVLGLASWGSCLASVTFCYSGFMTIHSSHEMFCHSIAYIPWILWMTERYLASGRIGWVGGVGLAMGVQLFLGHFQMQTYTGAAVIVTGFWRALIDQSASGHLGRTGQGGTGTQASSLMTNLKYRFINRSTWARVFGLMGAVGLASALAAIQLNASWELARFVGFDERPFRELAFYFYPSWAWPESVIPQLYRGFLQGHEDPYWYGKGTSGFEACLYIGAIPLVLAVIGFVPGRGDRSLHLIRVFVVVSLALATMPAWWLDGYRWVTKVPGLGLFRCAARYLVWTHLGLALLAGSALDPNVSRRRIAIGSVLAAIYVVAAFAWSIVGVDETLWERLVDGHGRDALIVAAATWISALLMLVFWSRNRNRLGPLVLILATGLELGYWYYHGTTRWGWSRDLASSSPTLEALAASDGVERVTGQLDNIPVRLGQATATPYIGFAQPPPHPELQVLEEEPRLMSTYEAGATLRRLGVTHGVWEASRLDPALDRDDVEVIREGPDPMLDRLTQIYGEPSERGRWRLVRYPDPAPDLIVARRADFVSDRTEMAKKLLIVPEGDSAIAWFFETDWPIEAYESPPATTAELARWDPVGLRGTVLHDGACHVVIRRTSYPGWVFRLNGSDWRPVGTANGGLQSVFIPSNDLQEDGTIPIQTTRFELAYHPTRLVEASLLSFFGASACLGLIATSWIRARSASTMRRSGVEPPSKTPRPIDAD